MKRKISVQDISNLCLYIVLGISAILLPVILHKLKLPIISNTYGLSNEEFELFGFCGSVALIVIAYVELKKRSKLPFNKLLIVILPLLVGFHFLFVISEYSHKIFDYNCYEAAAKAIIERANPYTNTACPYSYPPITAQALALVYQFTERGLSLLHINLASAGLEKPADRIWNTVFYFYQCCQFLLVILTYFLCYSFARKIGLKSLQASLLITALLLLNNPLTRTLRHDQVNLWVLDSFLLAILLLRRYPLVSGLAVALGWHIKLYPIILLLPWSLTKQWRAVLGAIISFVGILLIQTNGGRNWELWQQFLLFFSSGTLNSSDSAYTPDAVYFRNNSLHSIIYNFGKILRFSKITGLPETFTKVVFLLVMFIIAAWFVIRFIKREQAYFALVRSAPIQTRNHRKNTFRLYGHSMDALALSLLISPSVWEHHYVLAIPIAIWAVATQGYNKPWQVGIGIFLMFALPIFDVFPFSYHRIIGLLLLLYTTSPERLPTVAPISKKQLVGITN